MGFIVTGSNSELNEKNAVSNVLDARNNRSSGEIKNIDDVFSAIEGMGDYDVVGINATKVEPMRAAIRDYVAKIDSHLEEALDSSRKNMNLGFRGTAMQDAVSAYLNKVERYCRNLTSTLLVFSDKLADVSNAWLASTQKMATNVDSATGSFSAGETYKDTMTANSRGGGSSSGFGSNVINGLSSAAARVEQNMINNLKL